VGDVGAEEQRRAPVGRRLLPAADDDAVAGRRVDQPRELRLREVTRDALDAVDRDVGLDQDAADRREVAAVDVPAQVAVEDDLAVGPLQADGVAPVRRRRHAHQQPVRPVRRPPAAYPCTRLGRKRALGDDARVQLVRRHQPEVPQDALVGRGRRPVRLVDDDDAEVVHVEPREAVPGAGRERLDGRDDDVVHRRVAARGHLDADAQVRVVLADLGDGLVDQAVAVREHEHLLLERRELRQPVGVGVPQVREDNGLAGPDGADHHLRPDAAVEGRARGRERVALVVAQVGERGDGSAHRDSGSIARRVR
jgi:hypothetical protein